MYLKIYLSQAKDLSKIAIESGAWLDAHRDARLEIEGARDGINHLQFAIPIFGGITEEEFITVHPWHHLVFEAVQDLDSAFLLLLMGFYKDSFRAMRSYLELTLFALSNFIEEDRNYFNAWLAGKKPTPRLNDLLEKIYSKNCARELNEKLDWGVEITTLYSELSGYIHTRGTHHTNTFLRSTNVTVFSESGMGRGLALLLKTMRLTAEGFVAVFPMALQPLPLFEKFAFSPPAGGFLDEGQVNGVKAIFEKPALHVLTQICLSDPEVISLTEWVQSSPNLSEIEIAESIKRTLESKEFADSKEMIIGLLKEEKFSEAVAYIHATQRAIIGSINTMLFNPFYPIPPK